jgi:hypothetical protein
MKKTNKENPVTFFRKANEARQGKVMKSLKKAQDGIEMNDDLINKPGYSVGKSKEGFKNYTTPRIETQSISPNDPYERYKADLDSQKKIINVNANAAKAKQAATNKFKTDRLNQMYSNYKGQQKKGGSIKRKK